MTNRVLFQPNNIRVSKPGFDVTGSLNPDQLLLDALAGIGYIQSATGTVTIAGYDTYPVHSAQIPYTGNGSIPFVLVQINRGSEAVGGGFTSHTHTTSYLEDTSPARRVYETAVILSDTEGLDFYYSTTTMFIRNFDNVSRTVRYYVFTARQASNTGGTYPTTMTNGPWGSISGDSSSPRGDASVTITGIGGPITLRLLCDITLATSMQMRVHLNGVVVATINSGSSFVDFSVTLGDSVWYEYSGTVAASFTAYVQNVTAGLTTHNGFSVSITGTIDYTLSNVPVDVSVTGNSGGSSYLLVDQRFNPVAGITVTVPLYLVCSRALVAGEVIQIYTGPPGATDLVATFGEGSSTSAIFNVVNGYDLRMRYASISGSHSIGITLMNNYTGSPFSQGSWTATITDTYVASPDYTLDPLDVGDVYGEAYFNANTLQTGSAATISGVNQTISMRFQMSTTVPTGMQVLIAKNNSTYVVNLSAGDSFGDFTVVSGDSLDARGLKSTVGHYTGQGSFLNLSTGGNVVDVVNFDLLKSSGAPP